MAQIDAKWRSCKGHRRGSGAIQNGQRFAVLQQVQKYSAGMGNTDTGRKNRQNPRRIPRFVLHTQRAEKIFILGDFMANGRYILYKYCESGGEMLSDVKVKRFLFDKSFAPKLLYNALICEFKHKIYYIEDEKGVVHYSMCIGKCNKFPFLKKHDFIIGPCWTRNDSRGKRIYPKMINYIAAHSINKFADANVYILVREENVASTKGVLRSDFKKIGYVEKTPKLKIYSKVYLD